MVKSQTSPYSREAILLRTDLHLMIITITLVAILTSIQPGWVIGLKTTQLRSEMMPQQSPSPLVPHLDAGVPISIDVFLFWSGFNHSY